MNFYGVGTRFGGTDSFLNDCLQYNFWCMGNPDEKQLNLYHKLNKGDVLIAKKHFIRDGYAFIEVEAIGIVADTKMPDSLPKRFIKDEIYGVSVVWIKKFPYPISFCSKNNVFEFGGNRPRSIYCEDKENWIDEFIKMMKYDYIEKSEEKETYNPFSKIPDSVYIEIANAFILDEACCIYEEEDFAVYPDNDNVEIVAQDSFGRKIIRVPFEVDVCKKGLILLVPEKDWRDNEIRLCNMGVEFMNENADESEAIGKLKSQTDWDSQIDL